MQRGVVLTLVRVCSYISRRVNLNLILIHSSLLFFVFPSLAVIAPTSKHRQQKILEFFIPRPVPLRVRDLSAHLLELLLSKLPVIDRLAAQRVCKRWRDILHAPVAWSTLDLRGVPGCCVTGSVASKVLRYAALALPAASLGEAAAPGLAQPASLLRRLRIETSSNGPASATNFAAIGRHPSMATVEELAIVALNGSDIVVSTGFMRELDLAQLSFPS